MPHWFGKKNNIFASDSSIGLQTDQVTSGLQTPDDSQNSESEFVSNLSAVPSTSARVSDLDLMLRDTDEEVRLPLRPESPCYNGLRQSR